MPEGPEIRRAADTIAKVLEGRTLQEIGFAFPHLQGYESELAGQVITEVGPRGKAMLIYFANGLAVYSHNQLYGRWVTSRSPEPPTTRRQIRLRLRTDQGTAWLLSASEIEVLDEQGRSEHSYLAKLGPDPLDPKVNVRTLKRHWTQARFSRRALAALLLDQSFLTGVGNYLRSEILFVAGLYPGARLPADTTKLAKASIELFRRSLRTKGITCGEALAKKLKAKGWKRQQYRHWVFGRDGKPCHLCGTTIEKLLLAGRRLYRCPGCQPEPL